MSNKNLVALIFAVSMAVWLFSGTLASNILTADENPVSVPISPQIQLVRGMKSTAEQRQIYLDVLGQTQANRTVQVKSEITGVVEQVPGEKGKKVKAGDLLCQVAVDTRRSELAEATAKLKSSQLEYDGIQVAAANNQFG